MHYTLNAQEAAEALGLHRNTVQAWLRDGRIRGEKVGAEWRIPAAEVARLQDERATLAEAGQGLQAAGQLLRDLAERRWNAAERATAEAASKMLEARSEAERALQAGEAGAVELAQDYNAQLDALAEQVDRLREAERVVWTANDLHAEGAEKAKQVRTPVALFPGNPTPN